MLFAKLLLVLSVLAASEAFNIITPENQHQISGLIASLLTPEDKKRLLKVAFGHKNQNQDSALRSDNVKWELSYSARADAPPPANCARVSIPSRVVVQICGCDDDRCPICDCARPPVPGN